MCRGHPAANSVGQGRPNTDNTQETSMSWDTFHHRTAIMAGIGRRELESGDALERWRDIEDAAAWFTDDADVLRECQQRWHSAVMGAVDCAIEMGSGDLYDDVRNAYRAVCRTHPGLRAILDHWAGDPAIHAACDRERAALASAAGVEQGSSEAELLLSSPSQRVPRARRGSWLRARSTVTA